MALTIVVACVALLSWGLVALAEWGDAHREEWEIEDKVRKAFIKN